MSSLSPKAVERVFARLLATYGQEWERKFEAVDPGALMAAWGHELSIFSSAAGYARIAWALENLPEKCPNAIQFKTLCRQSPAPDVPMLPLPPADPQRVAAELAKLGHVPRDRRGTPGTGFASMKDWARVLIARHEAGENVRPISLRFAREALARELSDAPKNPYADKLESHVA